MSTQYVFDTVVLSNYALADALDLLIHRYKGRAVVTTEVLGRMMGAGYYCPINRLADLL